MRRWEEDIDGMASRAVQQRRLPGAQGETQVLSSPGMQVIRFNVTRQLQLLFVIDDTYWFYLFEMNIQCVLS